MYRLLSSPWLALGVALLLRAGTAVLTEFRPIFPSHYYTDARIYDAKAREVAETWMRDSKESILPGGLPVGKGVYTMWAACTYHLFGARPLLMKLQNALLSVASLYFLYRLSVLLVSTEASLLVLWFLTLWPSHVYYSSQNLKESATIFCVAGVLYAYCRIWAAKTPAGGLRDGTVILAGALLLFVTGFFRQHLIPFLAPPLILGGLCAAYRDRTKTAQLMLYAAACTSLILTSAAFQQFSPMLRKSLFHETEVGLGEGSSSLASFYQQMPEPNDSKTAISPLTPDGLTRYRQIRLAVGQEWSERIIGRRIKTQLFPKEEFRDWLDVFLFLPKAMFYILFMPLPFLYPMDGSYGRMLASLENTVLLALFITAAWGAARFRREPVAWSLIVFFCLIVPPSALLEFDLGSATRHKLQYFPCILPFAAQQLLEWRQSLQRRLQCRS